jgi:putative radical SAM enzyme (TIGR03279 family)
MEQKMKEKRHVISEVFPGSIAEELELAPGDVLLSVNSQPVEDVFDYRYLMNDEFVVLEIEKPDGEIWELEVEKEYEEDLGAAFENGLMDEYRSCRNKCMFCFIDQMPPGMRKTLYFKDDDSRLSFLQGNYVTLTNMSDKDVERIIRFHLSPINISFQTMNPKLRCEMLHNRFAGEALAKVDKLFEAGIAMNGQIVLCPGVNDKEELEYSLRKLADYAPVLESVSVVPVGLTKFRDGLSPLRPFTGEEAGKVLECIHRWQDVMMERHGTHFVHASDEWYLLAGQELPEEARYDGYLQLENGVGMLRLLLNEVDEALKSLAPDERKVHRTIATGRLAAPCIQKCVSKIQEKFPGVQVDVIPIENRFFGELITVSGLLTGQDLREQLSGRIQGDALLLPCNMLRSGEDVFLDDVRTEELEKELDTRIVIVDEGGADFVEAVLNAPVQKDLKRRQMYEQTGSCDCGQA